MQAASELLSRPSAKGGRGKTSGAGEVEAAEQHRVQRRKLLCFSEELEEERSRKLSNPDAAPLCCRCIFRLSRALFALGGGLEEGWRRQEVQGRGGRSALARLGAVQGRSACISQPETELLLGNEGPAAAWSEIQLAAAVCFSWSKGASETL